METSYHFMHQNSKNINFAGSALFCGVLHKAAANDFALGPSIIIVLQYYVCTCMSVELIRF